MTIDVRELVRGSADLIQQFLEQQGVNAEVIVIVAPRWDPEHPITASTADEENANVMLRRSMTREDPEDT
jgi:hypothetical protein